MIIKSLWTAVCAFLFGSGAWAIWSYVTAKAGWPLIPVGALDIFAGVYLFAKIVPNVGNRQEAENPPT